MKPYRQQQSFSGNKIDLLQWLSERGDDSEYGNLHIKPSKPDESVLTAGVGPTSKEFLGANPHARMELLRGPIGCGKTFLCCQHGVNIAANLPVSGTGPIRCRGLIIRNTADQLQLTTLRTWFEAFPAEYGFEYIKGRSGAGEFYTTFNVIDANGNKREVQLEVFFRAIEQGNYGDSLLSLELTWVYCNEVRELKSGIFQKAASRTSRFPGKGEIENDLIRPWSFADSNSFDDAHPLYKLFYDRHEQMKLLAEENEELKKRGRKPITISELIRTYDYASGLDEENADYPPGMDKLWYIRQMSVLPQATSEILIKNKFGAPLDGEPCYTAWNPNIHIIRDYMPNRGDPIWLGIDGGFDSAYVLMTQTSSGHFIVIDEFRAPKRDSVSNIAKLAVAYFAEKYPFFGPDGWNWVESSYDPGLQSKDQGSGYRISKFVNDALESRKLPYAKSAKGTKGNDPTTRIEIVNSNLSSLVAGEPRLRIADNCTWLIRAMTAYHYRKLIVQDRTSGQERINPKPEKNMESHIAEALQYGLCRNSEAVSHINKRLYAHKSPKMTRSAGMVKF